jgi:hypothetical protein
VQAQEEDTVAAEAIPADQHRCDRDPTLPDRRGGPAMSDWLGTHNESVVAAAQGHGDRFGLWIELVKLHLGTLPGGGAVEVDRPADEWRDRYETGWSPRQAAFAAWAYHTTSPGRQSRPPVDRPALPDIPLEVG